VRGEQLNDGLSAVVTGHGPPLVVLPGLGQGADLSVRVPRSVAWSAAALATGFQRTVHSIYRPVRPPAGMTIADLARWYATALAERFGEPVDIMGVSGGGVTALQLLLDYPQAVRRLALCVAASRGSDRGRRDLQRIVDLERQGRSTAWISSGLIAHGPLRLLAAGAYGLSPRRPREPGEAALVEAAQTWDVTARLGEIRAPVLVAGGSRDPIIPPDLLRATAAGIPGARLLLLPGRGHFTALYDRRLKPAIAALLAEPTAGPAGQPGELARLVSGSANAVGQLGFRCAQASRSLGGDGPAAGLRLGVEAAFVQGIADQPAHRDLLIRSGGEDHPDPQRRPGPGDDRRPVRPAAGSRMLPVAAEGHGHRRPGCLLVRIGRQLDQGLVRKSLPHDGRLLQ
jgi:pimeloyl-ACP methyl ester carboxylesterase